MTSEEMENEVVLNTGSGVGHGGSGPVKTEIHAMLLIAEAIHRLASAVEKLEQKPKIPVRPEGSISYSVGGAGGEGPKGSPL
jgi:hypothetical protein